jgi:hypothetical protein
MRIGCKAEYYRLMERGFLGNTLRNWHNVDDVWNSGVKQIGFREMNRSGGGGAHEVIPRYWLYYTHKKWVTLGRSFIMDEAAPDSDCLLQGEICRTFRGLEGCLGVRTGHRMRDSMRLGLLQPVKGLIINALLDIFLDPSSRDDIEILLELYPEATIEFAAYPYTLGKIPGRNTVIWEVRDY